MSIARTLSNVVSLSVSLGLAAACATSKNSAVNQPTNAQTPRSLAYGYHSGLAEASQVVVRDAQAFEELWKRNNNTRIPTPERPQVDFEKEMVLFVALGQRPTGGYGVRIEETHKEGDKLVVEALETKPKEGALVPMALSSPYDLAAVPRFDGEVVFKVRDQASKDSAR